MRVTQGVIGVLEAMISRPAIDWWGLDLARVCGLPTSTVYGVLARLEDAGIVEAQFETGDAQALERPLRRLYRLSPDGAAVARRTIRDWHQKRGRSRPPRGQIA